MGTLLDQLRQGSPPGRSSRTSLMDQLRTSGVSPGSSPQNPINEQHPDVPNLLRFGLKNFARSNPKVILHNLQIRGLDAVPIEGEWGSYAISRKGENKWYRLDERKSVWESGGLGALAKDVGDIATDIIGGPVIGAAATLGAAGGPAGSIGAAGLAGAAYDAKLRQTGQMLGIKYPLSGTEEAIELGWGFAGGAGAETVGRIGKAIKGKIRPPPVSEAFPERDIVGELAERLPKQERAIGKNITDEELLSRIPKEGKIPFHPEHLPAGKRPDIVPPLADLAEQRARQVKIDPDWTPGHKAAILNAADPTIVGREAQRAYGPPRIAIREEAAKEILNEIARQHPSNQTARITFITRGKSKTAAPGIYGKYEIAVDEVVPRNHPSIPREAFAELKGFTGQAKARAEKHILGRYWSILKSAGKIPAGKSYRSGWRDLPLDSILEIENQGRIWRVLPETAPLEKLKTAEEAILKAEMGQGSRSVVDIIEQAETSRGIKGLGPPNIPPGGVSATGPEILQFAEPPFKGLGPPNIPPGGAFGAMGPETAIKGSWSMSLEDMARAAAKQQEQTVNENWLQTLARGGKEFAGRALKQGMIASAFGGMPAARRSFGYSALRAISEPSKPFPVMAGLLGLATGGVGTGTWGVLGATGVSLGYRGAKRVISMFLRNPQSMAQAAQIAPGPVKALLQRAISAAKMGPNAYRAAIYILAHNPEFKAWVASQNLGEED